MCSSTRGPWDTQHAGCGGSRRGPEGRRRSMHWADESPVPSSLESDRNEGGEPAYRRGLGPCALTSFGTSKHHPVGHTGGTSRRKSSIEGKRLEGNGWRCWKTDMEPPLSPWERDVGA